MNTLGIRTRYVRHNVNDLSHYSSQTSNIIYNIANNNPYIEYGSFIGYEIFGPFIYGYITWLHEKLVAGNFDKIYFLSRDGYYMKEVYESLYGKSENIKYLYVSRRLLQGAALWINPEIESVLRNMYLPKYFSLGWFIDMIGLEEKLCDKYIKRFNLSYSSQFERNTILKDRKFLEFYSCIKVELIKNSKQDVICNFAAPKNGKVDAPVQQKVLISPLNK